MTAQHGGSYMLDPKTGERTLIERTAEPAAEIPTPPEVGSAGAVPAAEPVPEAATPATTPAKRRAAAGKD